MIIIFRKSALPATGNVWPHVVLSGLMCVGFAGHAFEPSQNVANQSAAPQASTLSDNLPVVMRAQEKLQPIPYQPLLQHSIDMPQLRDWKQSNNRVKDLGGWMFYASEAAAADDTTKHIHQHQHVETVPVKDQP